MANGDTESVDVKLPSGETITTIVPTGWSDAQIQTNLRAKHPEFFTPEAAAAANPPKAPLPNIPMKPSLLAPSGPLGLSSGPPTGAMPGSFEGHPENIGGYVGSVGSQTYGGVKNIAKGNIARGTNQLIGAASTAALPMAPFALPSMAAAPLATGLGITGGIGGSYGAGKAGEAMGASPDQVQLLKTLGGLVGGYSGAKIAKMLPSTAHAQELFGQVSEAAGSAKVGITHAGDAALEAKKLADAGTTMPKVLTRFLNRVTDPDAGPLTYDEARLFYQNAGRLSAMESQRMNPAMKRLLDQFRVNLGSAIGETAAGEGVGPQYTQAMTEYRRASQIDKAVRKAGWAIAIGGGTVAAEKMVVHPMLEKVIGRR